MLDANYENFVNIDFSARDEEDFDQEKHMNKSKGEETYGSSEHSLEDRTTRTGSGKRKIFTSKNIVIFILIALLGCSACINMYIFM